MSQQLQKTSNVADWLGSPATLDQFRQALPSHFPADRMRRLALTAFRQNPRLRECDPASVMASIMMAAQHGLEIGVQGKAYLAPYGKECTLIVGYRGLIELVLRSGMVRTIAAHVVYHSDDFRIAYHEQVPFVHIPNLERPDNDRIIGCYMHAVTATGEHVIEWMSKSEVDAIRNRSRSGKSGPWQTDYNEMMRKTVVRRGVKYLSMSTEVSDLLAAEEAQDTAPVERQSVARPVSAATHGASIPTPPPAAAPTIELDFTTDGSDADHDNGDDL